MEDASPQTRGFSLKDQLFNAGSVGQLADQLAAARAHFPREAFIAECLARFPDLELKARIDWMGEVLARHLPQDFPTALAHIRDALPTPLDPNKGDNDFGSFITSAYGAYVVLRGRAHFDLAMAGLCDITQRFSMEYALRTFIKDNPARAFGFLTDWATHPHYHVRRLVSEGTRPLLPWATRLGLPADWALPLLDRLHADGTRFVTRSVSNHLNDIAKSHPELVVERLSAWRQESRQGASELAWMARHGMRTLVKQGHQGALESLGFAQGAEVVAQISLPERVVIGEVLSFEAAIEVAQGMDLVVDYALHFVKANGRTSRKVFKLKTLSATAATRVVLRKAHRLLAEATTYRLYPGVVKLDLMVNGQVVTSGEFDLVP